MPSDKWRFSFGICMGEDRPGGVGLTARQRIVGGGLVANASGGTGPHIRIHHDQPSHKYRGFGIACQRAASKRKRCACGKIL